MARSFEGEVLKLEGVSGQLPSGRRSQAMSHNGGVDGGQESDNYGSKVPFGEGGTFD